MKIYCLVTLFDNEEPKIEVFYNYEKAMEQLKSAIGELSVSLILDSPTDELHEICSFAKETFSKIFYVNENNLPWIKIGDWEFYIEEKIIH